MWLAYGAMLGLSYVFGEPQWSDWRSGVSAALVLGAGFVVGMSAANILYLLGPALESWVKPANPKAFRDTTVGMGFWGSVALPFALPLINLATLIASSRYGPHH